MRRTILAAAAGVTATVAVAACSGATTRSAGAAGAAGAAGSAARRPASAFGARAGAGPAGTASGPSSTQRGVTLSSTGSLILTGAMSVTVRAPVAAAADRAETLTADAGGRTDADQRSTPADDRMQRQTATLTLRVPNAQVTVLMDRLAALGTEQSRRLSTRDVTQQVADVASRVLSARAAIASLNRLYQRATKVGDVIDIETTLSQREADLESLEAQQNAVRAQTALATITLTLITRRVAAAPPATHASSGGFVGGLQHGWHAFAVTVMALATALGATLPFLAVLLLGAVAALVVRRHRARRPIPPQTEG